MSITAFLFLLFFGAGLVLSFVRHPIYGLYAYLLAFYLNPTAAWWSQELPSIRWSLIAAIVTLIATIGQSRNREFPLWLNTWPARLLIVYVAWMWIQSIWALGTESHLEMSILFSKYVILFYLIYTICRDGNTITAFALAHIAGTFYLGWRAFGIDVSGRLEGLGVAGGADSNTFGMYLTTGLAFAGVLLLGLRDWRRWAVFLAIPFIFNGIVLAGSRGTFVGLLAAGFAAWYLKPRVYRRWFYFASVLALILFVRLSSEFFLERIGGTLRAVVDEQVELDSSATSRLAIAEAQWEMAKDYPLGAGGKGTNILSPYYIDPRYLSVQGARSSHSTLMAVLVDQGFPGLLLYVIGVLWVAKTLHRLKMLDRLDLPAELGLYRAAIGAALAAAFVSGQFSNFLKAEVQIWLIALLAVVWSLAQSAVVESTDARLRNSRKSSVSSVKG